MAYVTTSANSAFIAAEILEKQIGIEAAQRSNMPEVVWVKNLVGDDSMTAHFRYEVPMTASVAVEGTGLPSGTWTPVGVTITAGLDGLSTPLTKLMNSISPEALGSVSRQSGTALARAVDTSLCSLFSSLTGGTVGTSGGALTLQNILTANANLDANHADEIGPYAGRLHPHQFLNLYTDIMGKPQGLYKLSTDASGKEVIDVAGTEIRKNTLVSKINSSADWGGGIFCYQAIGLVIAATPTVEVLPIPGYAAYSVDAFVGFGVGTIRPTLGLLVQSGVNA